MPVRAAVRRGRGVVNLAGRRAVSAPLPVPIGGWNARDAISAMKPTDAVILDNWFPRTSDLVLRGGSAAHATGLSTAVESLMVWNGPSASKMFAAANSAVYEVTSASAVGAAEFGSLNSTRFQHTNFANSAGAFLYVVNGADAPRYYDGSSWTTPTITGSGLTASNLNHVATFQLRLLFVENNKLGFWYFPVETIAGAISYFDLGSSCRRGGHLVALGTWTRDGGEGLDDFLACVTSQGEVVIFQGSNPGSTSSWRKVGTFRIGAPVGKRCLAQLGGDLVIITQDGFAPLSALLVTQRLDQRATVSDKIRGAVQQAFKNYGSNFGWQPLVYPRGNMVLFNVPVTAGATAHQYVSNTTTGAWCRFKGWNAGCLEILNDELYFGGAGTVYKADTGLSDAGVEIETDAQTAFSYLGRPGLVKEFTMGRSLFASDGTVNAAMGAVVDFEDRKPTAGPTFSEPAGADWDTADWDVSGWADVERLSQNWQTLGGVGYAMALRLLTKTKNTNLRWLANQVVFQPGSLL